MSHAKFNELFNQVQKDANDYLTKKALEDPTVLTRTESQEVGKVPAVNSDIDDEKKSRGESITEIGRKKPIENNPGNEKGDPAVKSVNEPPNPEKAEKIARAKNLLKRVRALKNSGNAKTAGANDLETFLNDFIYEEADQVKTAEEELAEHGGAQVAKLVNMIKEAGNIENFIIKKAEEEKLRQQQDYAIAYEIGKTMKKMEKQAAKLKAEIKSLKKGGVVKEAGVELDIDARDAAKAKYDEVMAEKELCKKANIDWKMANTQLYLEKLREESSNKNF